MHTLTSFEGVENRSVKEGVFGCVVKVLNLSKTQSPSTTEERERTKVIPYALAIGSIVYYVVYRT